MIDDPAIVEVRALIEDRERLAKDLAAARSELERTTANLQFAKTELREAEKAGADVRAKFAQSISILRSAAKLTLARRGQIEESVARATVNLVTAVDAFVKQTGGSVNQMAHLVVVQNGKTIRASEPSDAAKDAFEIEEPIEDRSIDPACFENGEVQLCKCGALVLGTYACGFCRSRDMQPGETVERSSTMLPPPVESFTTKDGWQEGEDA